MKALLLAAGLGTRLLPITAQTPKCMVRVSGTPVLQHNIEWLRDSGVTDLAVNLHHLSAIVQEYFEGGERFGVSIHYSYEPELLGTGGAIARLRPWIGDDDFLVVYADNITTLDLPAFIEVHRARRASATIALYWRAEVSASGVAELAPDGRITAFVEKPKPGQTNSHWVNAGVIYCSPRVLNYLPEGFSDVGRDVLPSLLCAQEVVTGYKMTGDEQLHWIDTLDDLRSAEAALSSRTAPR